jgi:hypothetical protein
MTLVERSRTVCHRFAQPFGECRAMNGFVYVGDSASRRTPSSQRKRYAREKSSDFYLQGERLVRVLLGPKGQRKTVCDREIDMSFYLLPWLCRDEPNT